MGFWFYQSGIRQLIFVLSSAAASVFLFVFGLAGVLKAIIGKEKNLYYLLALSVFTPLIIFVTVVETRYRFQIYPLLAILSGFFIAELFGTTVRWWRNKVLWLAAGTVFLNGIVDLILNVNKIVDKFNRF